ncbi:ankyrin repeat-containing domain protein [Xylariaceae sp. FL1272]|nr:ankyrin repeat-containing domain protein [Xylariaceae sp. FL1272]
MRFLGPQQLCSVNSIHLAILSDAPAVIVYLLKQGVGMSEQMKKHVDLLSLCLVLCKVHATQSELDKVLRTAVTYRLSRCVANLLVRGAGPNSYNQYGLTATHYVFLARVPLSAQDWAFAHSLVLHLSHNGQHTNRAKNNQPKISHADIRRAKLLNNLVTYGVDLTLRTRTTRFHACDEECWKSVDCYQGGESVSHLAASSGCWLSVYDIPNVDLGLSTSSATGHTPLFKALCRGRLPTVKKMLGLSLDKDSDMNPVVQNTDNSTALHIACRFAFVPVVSLLLSRGAFANVTDRQGRTPLHEALRQTMLGRDENVLATLNLLAEFGAHADTTTATRMPTPRTMAKTHPIPRVREMFKLEAVEKPPRLPKKWLK